MIGFLKRFVAPVAAIALLGLGAATASAEVVTYTTTGAFSGPDVVAGSLVQAGITLSFTGQALSGVVAPPVTIAPMGTFTTSGTGGPANFSADTFTLTIQQYLPGAAGPTPLPPASLTGTISMGSSGLAVDFGGNTLQFLGGGFLTTYYPSTPSAAGVAAPTTINPPGVVIPGSPTNTTLQGSINAAAVPLPATASMGLSLLGGLGLLAGYRGLVSRKTVA